ncbi:unnamed protein product [Closterium sp. NIES-53]
MACIVSSSPSVMSITSLDYTQICLPPCVSLDKNRVNSIRYVFPPWSSPHQHRFAPLDHSVRKAFVRIRSPDWSFAIRCSAENASMPSESPEAAVANLQPTDDDKATTGTDFDAGNVGKVEVGADREGEESVRIVEEKQGGSEEVGKRRGRRAGNVKARSEGRGSKSGEGGASEEEQEAIVKEEEEGLGNGRSGGWEEIEGGEESDATTVAAAAAVEEEVGMDTEMQDEEVEAEASEEGLPSMPSRPTRATSRSFLLSLYRFFSSHLGISSPSTVASLLASYPQLLHFNPTNNFLPSVRLLQSFGISLADIVHITVRGSVWLRSPLPQINNKLEFLLDKGVRRSRLDWAWCSDVDWIYSARRHVQRTWTFW